VERPIPPTDVSPIEAGGSLSSRGWGLAGAVWPVRQGPAPPSEHTGFGASSAGNLGRVTPRRLSTTHGPRLDEELKRETASLEQGGHEARAQEAREHEGAADDEPRAELVGSVGLLDDPVLARRELSRHLRRTAFPAGRHELLAEAERNDAPRAVLDLLAGLPDDREFATVYEAWDALGGELEPRVHEVLEERE